MCQHLSLDIFRDDFDDTRTIRMCRDCGHTSEWEEYDTDDGKGRIHMLVRVIAEEQAGYPYAKSA